MLNYYFFLFNRSFWCSLFLSLLVALRPTDALLNNRSDETLGVSVEMKISTWEKKEKRKKKKEIKLETLKYRLCNLITILSFAVN